jgi:ubiquinone/menaquinone biosynthesis C-methylase UbiE
MFKSQYDIIPLIPRIYSGIYRFSQIDNKILSYQRGNFIDIGCGPGEVFDLIDKSCLRVGIDVSRSMLAYAKNRNKNVDFICASAECLPLRDNSFDSAICTGVFEELSHPEIMLDETRRILKQEGNFILAVHDKHSFIGSLAHIIAEIFGSEKYNHSYSQLQEMLMKGFKIKYWTRSTGRFYLINERL